MGVSPLPLWLPLQCDKPREGNNSTITLRRGGLEVAGTVHSIKAFVLYILYYDKKILQSRKMLKNAGAVSV
jgi:hypothetical protein